LYFIVDIGFLGFASALVYKALIMPAVFLDSIYNKKYKTSPLAESDKIRYLQRIDACMKTDRPYLNPALTLNDLSKKASVPTQYISQILNETLNQKFYDYINAYRIEETKNRLSDPHQSGKTITEIYLESGFNSKSVFNAAFKKLIGMTPREFRERSLNPA
jgi:AraC-like DNA-binding protein